MGKVAKQIECLARLNELTGQLFDIVYFLKDEGLIDDNQIRTVKGSSDGPKEIQLMLRDLQVRGKIQLLEYTWNVLPVENIVVYLITDRNQKEFVYNG